jgi:hypothetical protein
MDNFSTDRGVSFDTTMRLQARSGNQESKVDAARLQRKRALDRKSQNAMRERTRLRIQSLEQQLASCGETICRLREKNEYLETENHRLEEKCALAERSQEEQWQSGYVPPASGKTASCQFYKLSCLRYSCVKERINLTPIYDQIISDNRQTLSSNAGRLSNLTNPATALASNIITPPRRSSPLNVLTLPAIREPLFAPQEFYQALPCNSKPNCLSDQILHGFITAQLSAQLPTSDFSSSCRRPSIAPLFMPETKTHIDPVSQVVTDILRCFTEIATLPEQVAGLYLMFRLLNVSQNLSSSQEILVRSDSLLKNTMQWRIKKTQEAYEDMPEWLRPIPLQLRIPHPAWMDSIPWSVISA